MEDYIKRFLIACLMGACVSLLFLGGKNVQANDNKVESYSEFEQLTNKMPKFG